MFGQRTSFEHLSSSEKGFKCNEICFQSMLKSLSCVKMNIKNSHFEQMNDFNILVSEVRELSTLAHNAATHATYASKKAESAVLAMVFVAIMIVASLLTSARELNVNRKKETNIEVIAFLVAVSTVIFVSLTVIVVKMSETAAAATDASAAAARALIGMQVVEQAVTSAAERAIESILAMEETV